MVKLSFEAFEALARVPDPSGTPEEGVINAERRASQQEIIERYLAKRPSDQQDILRRYVGGQSPTEIARDLGIQVAGVNRAMNDFIRATRSWVENDGVVRDDVL